MSQKNNVIQFPDRKNENVPSQNIPPQPVAAQVPPSSPKKKIMAGIIAVFAVTVIANQYTPSQSLDVASQGRGLASVGERTVLPTERDPAWESSLAKELNGRGSRDLSSLTLGRNPSAEDRLRFGFLKSQYAVIMENGKLSEIRSATEEGHVYLGDGGRFLDQNKALMPVQFAAAVGEKRITTESGIQETYELLDSDHQSVGTASFGLDRYGRLLTFSVTSTTVH